MALEQDFAGSGSAVDDSIAIVGCGPGALDYVTPLALRLIEGAEVLVGASRLLDMFPASRAQRIVVGPDIPQALERMASEVGQRKVVVLVSGDPGICSLAQPVIKRFGIEACGVVPGISSVQVAFARLGVDWTGARLISAHRRAPDLDASALAGEAKIAVLAGNAATMPWVVELAQRLAETHTIFVCENLTLPHEKLSRLNPAELAAGKLSPQSILLFIGKKIRT